MIDQSILRLIAITDDVRDGRSGLIERARLAVEGGATSVQLRLKGLAARDLVGLARDMVEALPVPVIVNDRADVAIAAGAAGVHLGPDDVPVRAVRAFAPAGFLVGCSVGSDAEVEDAVGADYVGVGPVFPTLSKSDAGAALGIREFKRIATATRLPAVGIGGVTAANARSVIESGAVGVAVIAAVLGSTDPLAAARELLRAIER